ncbi:hypothetical protein FisN_9Lh075 [Fistulifera solaris]|uniref:Uncharacterized protein n=1 Tax=Fistulifera solaris TaxID=1519565 RepID=A0A1Z5KKK6_FISSO|nr:hypothetical protein FisN_9Lh075 [Fistulifera solaris]|eukprot:GAX26806.1 hypothetical protein FisN_9Lh075 [Fistulifera solaris]
MGVGFRRFLKRKSDASPARKYPTGSQHDSSASQDSFSSFSAPLHAPENSMSRTEVTNTVRSCIQQLKSQHEEQALDALKRLFALSSPEDPNASFRQRNMICVVGDALLPVLFSYIDSADGVYIQTALLVINNLSTVAENKQPLAMQGAAILARVLARDPSCHLAAIILVNLTFCDAELRRDLVLKKDFLLVETLALTLLTCSMDELEFCSKGEPALSLPADAALKELIHENDLVFGICDTSPSKACYPNTLKWAISALKNLTRPSKYDVVAHAVLDSGIVPHILRLATLKENDSEEWKLIQDAALYIIVHLTAIPSARPQLREVVPSALSVLTLHQSTSEVPHKALFQKVKARIAIAFLCGSEGHYGQPVCPRSMRENNENSVSLGRDVGSCTHLFMSDAEAAQLVELLANMLHQRSKDGPAGYSSSTFSVKYILFAIRCLLTQTHNQTCIAKTLALPCNALLTKALAMHLWQPEIIHLDPEAAEHAIFCLYLMSNHGFRTPFLPKEYGNDLDLKKSLAAKVFHSYRKRADITLAGKHAAEQLLLRLRYMTFQGSVSDLNMTICPSTQASDYAFDPQLLNASQSVIVTKLTFGACPRKDIFDRPILRRRAHHENKVMPVFGRDADYFPSALQAAQEFSFGSTKVRHVGQIDVVLIANNIANSANGQKTQSYSFVWNWQEEIVHNPNKLKKKHRSRRLSSHSFMNCSSHKSRSGIAKTVLSQLNLDRLCFSETA